MGYSICIDLGVGGGSTHTQKRATKATKSLSKVADVLPLSRQEQEPVQQSAVNSGSGSGFCSQTDAINTSFAFVLLSQIHSPVLGARLHHHDDDQHHAASAAAAAGQTIILR